MGENALIMRPFNLLFIAALAATLLLLAVVSLLLRGTSEKTRRTVLVAISLVSFAGFFVYKFFLSRDAAYNEITADMGGFKWWGEMPLQLCNINMILIPIAVMRKSRPLMCFGFFVGPLGAMMALALPGNGFSGYSILLPRMLGYYGTHFMIVFEGLALVSFGLFRPRLSDLPRAILALLALAAAIFAIDMLLRWSGVHPKANYFFLVETEGNSLLEVFHSWIPLPFLYMLPGIGILAVYMALVMLLFGLFGRKRSGKEQRA